MGTIIFKKRELDNNKNEEPDHEELKNHVIIEESMSFKSQKIGLLKLQATITILKKQLIDNENLNLVDKVGDQFDAAATKLQKFYKSYSTRRNLADCAVVVEELWWKELDSEALRRSSVSFFNAEKSETVVSKWDRARIRAAKVGKGLSKDEKAQKLALRHWLEAIHPRHRYGHNLYLYYDVWFKRESNQPFFYWLDIGDGKEVNLEKCPRNDLQRQCIQYLGPKERKAYEVILENGKLVYKQARIFVDTPEGSKWIFVLSTSRNLYVGEKKKGLFQHSSFLSGGATIASGRLVARNGILEAIWPFSGHYRPTAENFMEFCSFLEDHHVDLTNVKKYPIDDDIPPKVTDNKELKSAESAIRDSVREKNSSAQIPGAIAEINDEKLNKSSSTSSMKLEESSSSSPLSAVAAAGGGFELKGPSSKQWSTGAGPRIRCVRDYPTQLQFQALEQLKLSPRTVKFGPLFPISCGPIPSPRPTPRIHLSPRLAFTGLPTSPTIGI